LQAEQFSRSHPRIEGQRPQGKKTIKASLSQKPPGLVGVQKSHLPPLDTRLGHGFRGVAGDQTVPHGVAKHRVELLFP
jgi:hypothetical protein